MPERTTQDYEGPGMEQRVQQALSAALQAEDTEDLMFSGPEKLAVMGERYIVTAV
jgi:hypothetical protein